MRRSTMLTIATLAAPLLATPALAQTDAATGQKLYTQKCAICHAPNQNKIGPMHKGIVGKKIASVPGYAYSAAEPRTPRYTPSQHPHLLLQRRKTFLQLDYTRGRFRSRYREGRFRDVDPPPVVVTGAARTVERAYTGLQPAYGRWRR